MGFYNMTCKDTLSIRKAHYEKRDKERGAPFSKKVSGEKSFHNL